MFSEKPLLRTTLYRDLMILFKSQRFWLLFAFWVSLSSVIFFAYLNEFLQVQSTLRSKSFHYGVTDLVFIPYLKVLGIISAVWVSSLLSNAFYYEQFAPFAALYKSFRPESIQILVAKWLYLIIISALAVSALAIPIISALFFIDFNGLRVIFTLFSLYLFLLTSGILALLFSQIFSQGLIVILLTTLCLLVLELAARWVLEPAWFAPIVQYFSPIAHLIRITSGVVLLSDALFFVVFFTTCSCIIVRQFENNYFMTR